MLQNDIKSTKIIRHVMLSDHDRFPEFFDRFSNAII